MSEPKSKLRTVADVIARVRWSSEYSADTIVLGYDDRIHGPMEKALLDYRPIKDGGDIPEHRIWYVRTTLVDGTDMNNSAIVDGSILWEKLGRVDRVFGSGNGAHRPISSDTLNYVSQAINTMAQLDREKQERRALKEKQRAVKARKRANKAAAIQYLANKNETSTQRVLRYKWIPTPWYAYSMEAQEWVKGSRADSCCESIKDSGIREPRNITIVSWNVLFDLYDNELQDHEERWILIGTILERNNVDVIALQEATPKFVEIFLSQSWVKEQYAATASPAHTETVDASGNLILWRKNMLAAKDHGVFVCVDSFRQCSVMACLESVWATTGSTSPVLMVTNVHLLANKPNEGSRALARKRELASVLGHMHLVQRELIRSGKKVQPMIVGDFNTSDADDSLFGTSIDALLVDVWLTLEQGPGYTFDPATNVRAARTQALTDSSGGPKRLDRILLAGSNKEDSAEKSLWAKPVAVSLIGRNDNSEGELPPSDHYGLKACFQLDERPQSYMSYRDPGFNLWAANAPSTPDTLLAIVIDDSKLLGKEVVNSTSTLPVPHITLLHCFVDLSSSNFRELAIQTIREAFDAAEDARRECALRFTESSLDVFEHRASATLIARPDMQHPSMTWLVDLYKLLTTTFQQCHDQESRFNEGWTPHLSLGTFGQAMVAREEASRRIKDGRWIHEATNVPVDGVTIFERSSADGTFYAVASVPFERDGNIGGSLSSNSISSFASNFRGSSSGVYWEIQRACKAVAGDSVHVNLLMSGSHALGAALPMLSDLDAIIEIAATDDSKVISLWSEEDGIRFLGDLAARIKV